MKNPKPKGKEKKVKAWAIVSRGGVLIGGGTRDFGYTELCVYPTRVAAQQNLGATRPDDKVIPVTITYKP